MGEIMVILFILIAATIPLHIGSGGLTVCFVLLGGISGGIALWCHFFGQPFPFAKAVFIAAAIFYWLTAARHVLYRTVGKPHIRDQVLQSIPWQGSELVLNMGWGQSFLLIGAAKRLSTGKATGLEWYREVRDVLKEASREGVLDRVEVMQGVFRESRNRLPFPDAGFDVVVSDLGIHNRRADLLQEIVRVLKPGGRLAIFDGMYTRRCVRVLHEMGIEDARRVRVGAFSFWFDVILTFGLVQTYLVLGRKPSMTASIESSSAHQLVAGEGNIPADHARTGDQL
jgi:arsenite methyltransferase